ncbi:Aminomethyltransferase [Hartmannibacter diazotrophicus]|uniref:Aminomethyltransferase n=1 Tax=Hartmannibacter diazotrophicus TaxID=1482074 RepID=A0A2C9DBF9_9HYPH|nr:sarcosine oxidase subunit alpha family protein [Hartmannibacter diazotrophicus]SON56945.1 Aminomethyltransferase [Hartmannibacter diazotrophicus]
MTGCRLFAGGLIDRTQPLRFTFDGKAYEGHPGDTLASALLASGVTLFGRSFKYHRKRGIFGSGPEEPNALVTLRSGARVEPNIKATTAELYEGLEAVSQNRWPSLQTDLMAVNGLFSKLFVAGFYYKTFKGPGSLWEKLYEPMIRRAAGLGRASGLPDPDSYEAATAHCDLLVVGSGPAGLMAALAAGRAGVRVILADSDFRLGGRLLGEHHEIDGKPGAVFADGILEELASLPNVRLLPRTSVFGAYDDGTFGALEKVSDHLAVPMPFQPRQRFWTIVAKRSIVAAGASERPIVLSGNDLPGVMLAGTIRHYAVRQAVAVGQRVAIFTANDAGWHTAADLRQSGIPVVAIIDARDDVAPHLLEAVSDTRCLVGARVREVEGSDRVEQIVVETNAGTETIRCDALGLSGGFQPNIQLASHLGGRPAWDDEIFAFGHGPLPKGMALAGSAAGAMSLGDCLAGGLTNAADALEALGLKSPSLDTPRASDDSFAISPLWHVAGGKAKAFVDFQHDVTADDVALAAREGYVSVEHLKRYTTLGMATDQGRTANLNGLAILAELTNSSIPETGLVTSRPPIEPVAIGALAGPHRGRAFRPLREAPTNPLAKALGASMIESGHWWRAEYFPQDGETDWLTTVKREVMTVREGVGVTDMSTLGKIEVLGPDACAYLMRLFANSVEKLKIGRCTYGLMLREDGFAFDDGTIARLGETHYVVTCSTAHAAKVYEHFEFVRQVLFPGLDVTIQSVSEQWAQLVLVGPKARDALSRIVDPGTNISNDALPFLGLIETTVLGGVRARIFRLSFSGELAFEIAVPARKGAEVMAALVDNNVDLGVIPYGLEAVGVMRIEKGHPAAAEFNGQVSAHELGLGAFAERPHACIGRTLAGREELTDPKRGRLVGLKPVDRTVRLRAGAHLLPKGTEATAANDQGYVTSVAFSPVLDHWIGLGYLRNGTDRHGEIVRVYDPVRGGDLEAEVCPPCFVDPKGERTRG